MPLSLDAWKNGLEPADAELVTYLEKKPYQAYTLDDLTSRFSPSDNVLLHVARVFALSGQLNRLVNKGVVKSKVINYETYYVSSKAI